MNPNDLDVVTFYTMPTARSQQALLADYSKIVDAVRWQEEYRVDAYFIQADYANLIENVQIATYWYSMWSHRRDGLWKGFIQIDLASTHDTEAKNRLEMKKEVFQ